MRKSSLTSLALGVAALAIDIIPEPVALALVTSSSPTLVPDGVFTQKRTNPAPATQPPPPVAPALQQLVKDKAAATPAPNSTTRKKEELCRELHSRIQATIDSVKEAAKSLQNEDYIPTYAKSTKTFIQQMAQRHSYCNVNVDKYLREVDAVVPVK
jgi:ABC-type transporter Mla subunit MlaD